MPRKDGNPEGNHQSGQKAMGISKATQSTARAVLATKAITIRPLVVLKDFSIDTKEDFSPAVRR